MSQFYILIDEQRRQNALAFISAINLSRTYSVEVKQYRKHRSNAQNRLYWSWINIIGDDTGHDANDLHEMFKHRFLGTEKKKIFGHDMDVPKSTAKLTTQEFTAYLEKIEATAQTMGMRLPHPDDYIYAMSRDSRPHESGRVI